MRSSLRFQSRKRGPRSAEARLRRFHKLTGPSNSTMHVSDTDENEENSSSGTCIISRCLDDSLFFYRSEIHLNVTSPWYFQGAMKNV